MQIVPIAAYNIVPRGDEVAWLLLRVLRQLSILDTYLGLEVHDENTMEAGRKVLDVFLTLLEVMFLS